MANLPATYSPDFHDVDFVAKMTYNDFGSTGMKVSKLSLGTGGFSTIYGDFSLAECKETVKRALKAGINYIDTAPWYGQGVSEETLGKCLEGIPRNTYYIATKVGRYETDPSKMFDFSAEKTRQSINASLARLGLDYVDVIQVHDIEFAPSVDFVIKETLPVLEEAVKAGKARFIGVTGYPLAPLVEIIKKSPIKIDTVLSYSRLSLIDSALLDYLDCFKGMGIINAAGLAMGLLTNGGPQPWHHAHQDIKDVCRIAQLYCKEHNVELAKLAMNYLYEMGNCPHTQLVGMNNLKLLYTNLDVLLNGITDNERKICVYLQEKVFPKLIHTNWEGVEKY